MGGWQPISFCIVPLARRIFFFQKTPPPARTLYHVFVPDRDYIITMPASSYFPLPRGDPIIACLLRAREVDRRIKFKSLTG